MSGACWGPDSQTFIIGSQDVQNSLTTYQLSGPDEPNVDCDQIYTWSKDQKMRVFDLALSPDGRRLVALLDSCILVFDFITREQVGEFAFDKVIKMTSIKISADSQHMLVSMNENKIRLMVIDTGEVVQTFDGHKQVKFMIRSAFGGANESFVISGSEGELLVLIYSCTNLTKSRFSCLRVADHWTIG